jgi:hypothetical protein
MRLHTLITTLASTLLVAVNGSAASDIPGDQSGNVEPPAYDLDVDIEDGPYGPPDYGPRPRPGSRWRGLGEGTHDVDSGGGADLGDGTQDAGGDPPTDDDASADLNQDGSVDVMDLVAMLTQWGVCPVNTEVCQGDLNLDGFVDIEDLLALMTQWD